MFWKYSALFFFLFIAGKSFFAQDSIQIFVLERPYKKVELKKDLKELFENHSFVRADSIIYNDKIYKVYYKTDFKPDSIIFLSEKKIPAYFKNYYNRQIHLFEGKTEAEIKKMLKSDFITIEKTVPVTENDKKILYLRSSYRPDNKLQADLGFSRIDGKNILTGQMLLEFRHLLGMRDVFKAEYSATREYSITSIDYRIKNFPVNISSAWSFSQTRRDTLLQTQLKGILSMPYQSFGLIAGGYVYEDNQKKHRSFIFGADYSKHIRQTSWQFSLRSYFSGKSIERIQFLQSFKWNPNPGFQLDFKADRFYRTGIFNLASYMDFYTRNYLIGYEKTSFYDLQLSVDYQLEYAKFYVFSRGFGSFPPEFIKKNPLISGLGMVFLQTKMRLILEFSYFFKEQQPVVNQSPMILVKQQFVW